MSHKMTEVASKAVGTASAAKAALKGLKGVFRTLMKQHGEAATILKRLEKSSDLETRSDLWPKLRAELLSHERAEMAELYPVLRNYKATRDITERHDREAGELEKLIASIHGTSMADEQWRSQMERLGQMVSEHVSEEEGEFFPRAQEVIGEEKAEELDASFITAQRREKSQLSGRGAA